MPVTSTPDWKTVVVKALEDIGGRGTLQDIYNQIESSPARTLPDSWQSIVRRTLQQYSSDSQQWLGIEDLFHSVSGIGAGEWALKALASPDARQDVSVPTGALEDDGRADDAVIERLNLEQLSKMLAETDTQIQVVESGSTPQARGKSAQVLKELLERKKQIVERMRILNTNNNIASLNDLIAQVSDPSIQSRLQEQLAAQEADAAKWRDEAREIDKLERMARLKWEDVKTRSAIWHSFIEREAIASTVGGLLLIAITITMIISTFNNIKTPDILNNSFLVILGYFFGQAVAKATSRATEK